MARVLLSGALRRHAGGRAELSIEAPTYRELVAALEARFPGIAPLIEGRTSLAIDGEIKSTGRLLSVHQIKEMLA